MRMPGSRSGSTAGAGCRSTRRRGGERSPRPTRPPPIRPQPPCDWRAAVHSSGPGVRAAGRARRPRRLGRATPAACGSRAALAGALVSAIAALGLVKVARRQRRDWTDDPRRLASAARADLADRLRDQGLSLPARASLGDVTRALRPLGLTGSRFAAAAARARYGPADDAPASARDARRELRSLLRALRSSLPLRRRVRGYLSLRSLRAS